MTKICDKKKNICITTKLEKIQRSYDRGFLYGKPMKITILKFGDGIDEII